MPQGLTYRPHTNERLQCVAYLDQTPGTQLRNVRKPLGGLLGWLLRSEDRLVRKLRPETQASSHVRGSKVAIDYLVHALLEHSKCAEFSFAVPNPRLEEFEQWCAGYFQSSGRHVKVQQITKLLGNGLNAIQPDLWLNFHGDNVFPLSLRDLLSNRVYPAITVQHGLSNHSLLYEIFLKAMLMPTYPCDSFVCTSRACKKALTNILEWVCTSFHERFEARIGFNGRMDVIPLCVDTEQLHPGNKPTFRTQLGIPQDAVVLLYLGYLSQVKADLAPLLPVMRRLVDRNPGVNLLFMIAGTGPESYCQALTSLIQEVGLTNRITLLREITDAQKQHLLCAADVFVAPCDSLQESFGLTPVEAMACGLPQVIADWDGYRDTVVDRETGFLVPTRWSRCDGDLRATGDVLGWYHDHAVAGQSIVLNLDYTEDCLQTLICHPELRAAMSEHSRARAVAEFSYLSVSRRYDELWSELQAIASSLKPDVRTRRFDQPSYFDFFKHFASEEVKDDCPIRKSDNRSLTLAGLIRVAQAELRGISIFDEALLEQIISVVETSSSQKTFHQVTTEISNRAWSPDAVKRHIMFLLKHGKLVV